MHYSTLSRLADLKTKPKKPVQDLHFLIFGPVINQINQVFEEDWYFATNKKIILPKWNPSTKLTNAQLSAKIIPDGPDIDLYKLQWLLLQAISQAKKHLKIITPYFLPNDIISSALQTAALRGLLVEIILPQKSNLFYMNWATAAKFPSLLEKGIQIYQSPPPFDHSKLFIVDDNQVIIGSNNWDERSLRLNFEIMMECLSLDFNQKMQQIFEEKKNKAQKITLAELKKMSKLTKFRNNFTRLFSPYL